MASLRAPRLTPCAVLLLSIASLTTSAGCPAPEPPKAPVVAAPSEEEARVALEKIKKANDADAFFVVHNKYPSFPSGKKALHLGIRKLLEDAIDAAEQCDLPKAKGMLARVAPYTADDGEVDEAYDETKARVDGERQRCELYKVDEDVKRAEAAWDWPRAFGRIESEKEVSDGKALAKRRKDLTARYFAWLDDTLKKVVQKRSLAGVVDDKRQEFTDSTDPAKLPAEVGSEVAKRQDTIAAIVLVFDKLQGGTLDDPPTRHWTFGKARPRRIDTPTAVGTAEMANGISFYAVARGKIGDVAVLCWGSNEGNVMQRLGSIKALVPEVDARGYDTNTALPDQLAGARVLAPVATGSDLMTPSTVLVAPATGAIVVVPVASTLKKLSIPKVAVKKDALRGLVLPPGTPVMVLVGGGWKKAEVADAPEEDRVLVMIGGFESFVSIGDVRVSRKDLPKVQE
ncbi:MAG: hypothetical protein NVSMB47_22100 [Polyangiales bacterium]